MTDDRNCDTCKNSPATVMVCGGFMHLCSIDGEYHGRWDTCDNHEKRGG